MRRGARGWPRMLVRSAGSVTARSGLPDGCAGCPLVGPGASSSTSARTRTQPLPRPVRREGEEGDNFYVIQSGSFEATKGGARMALYEGQGERRAGWLAGWVLSRAARAAHRAPAREGGCLSPHARPIALSVANNSAALPLLACQGRLASWL